ncbi:hypothetical protein DCC62_27175 [candidate division KSB1 bacterium]|nr:MAG: hypothetical protein DCC62_27175 [candidate division KSB1 bacterium]
MIHIIRTRATPEQIAEMLPVFEFFIKLAVDIDREILAGGGARHADCEEVLLEDGSKQKDIWGADWYPDSSEVKFEALINIRPNQNNPAMIILDRAIRDRVEEIARRLLERP